MVFMMMMILIITVIVSCLYAIYIYIRMFYVNFGNCYKTLTCMIHYTTLVMRIDFDSFIFAIA